MENTVQLLNRIELTGIVGNVHRFTAVDRRMARVSVLTTFQYRTRDGQTAVDRTYLQCLICAPEEFPEFTEELHEGMLIHLKGRVRMDTYIDIMGRETQRPLVIVSECQVTEAEGMDIVPEGA